MPTTTLVLVQVTSFGYLWVTRISLSNNYVNIWGYVTVYTNAQVRTLPITLQSNNYQIVLNTNYGKGAIGTPANFFITTGTQTKTSFKHQATSQCGCAYLIMGY